MPRPRPIASFWGQALQYNNELAYRPIHEIRMWRKDYPQYDGRGRIDDLDERRMPVYIQRVPEAKTQRNRIRPEIAVRSPADIDALLALGATASGHELFDREGNEFSVAEGLDVDGIDRMLRSVVFDCVDPDRMVEFWSAATGYTPSAGRCDPAPGWRRREDGWLIAYGERIREMPGDDGDVFDLTPGLAFVKSDERKNIKNRLHIDLWTLDAETNRDRLVALGATVQRWDTDHVLLDPEGNEFCTG